MNRYISYRSLLWHLCLSLLMLNVLANRSLNGAVITLHDGNYVWGLTVYQAGEDFGGTRADFANLDSTSYLDLERFGQRPITGTALLGSNRTLVLTLELTGAVDYNYPLVGTFTLNALDFVVDGIPSRLENLTYNAAATRIGQYQHAGQFISPDISLTAASAFITYGYQGSGLAGDRPQLRFDVTTSPTPDLNLDGNIDAADAGVMFGNWGNATLGDLNTDSIVDAADAGMLFAEWTGDSATFYYIPETSHMLPYSLVSTALLLAQRRRGA